MKSKRSHCPHPQTRPIRPGLSEACPQKVSMQLLTYNPQKGSATSITLERNPLPSFFLGAGSEDSLHFLASLIPTTMQDHAITQPWAQALGYGCACLNVPGLEVAGLYILYGHFSRGRFQPSLLRGPTPSFLHRPYCLPLQARPPCIAGPRHHHASLASHEGNDA